jgi:uncharacterized OB-fold protein
MVDLLLGEGLFYVPKFPDEKPYLLGSRCRICGYKCFPKKEVCVVCRQDDVMEEIKIGPYGSLETFTVMQIGTPDFPAPYIIGYVRTKEGVIVFTSITGCEARDDALKIGEEMELVIQKIREDGEGNSIIGWKFKPIRSQSS